MRLIYILLLLCVLISCNSQGKKSILGKSEFQKEMNTKFKDASTSPLTKKGLRNFNGLEFFPISNKFKVTAKLTETKDRPIFKFPTTTDRIAVYEKYGVISFSLDGKDLQLDIYKDKTPSEGYENHLFLPFLDGTNGKTSYAGGRFIDVLTTDIIDGKIEIDFNKAYNPYCAYSDRYSCPITPRNNYLDVEVEAGVKAYKK